MTESDPTVDRWGDRLMAIFWRRPAATLAERTRRRVTLHLIPFLFFLYILAYVDRMSVAVAGLAMTDPPEKGGLGFTDDVKGMGQLIFFLGYWILEIPSTLWVERHGARWVFVRILILWGIVAALMAAIGTPAATTVFGWLPHWNEDSGMFAGAARFMNGLAHESKNQFYFLRFLLGFFEGGFFPVGDRLSFALVSPARSSEGARRVCAGDAAFQRAGVHVRRRIRKRRERLALDFSDRGTGANCRGNRDDFPATGPAGKISLAAE